MTKKLSQLWKDVDSSNLRRVAYLRAEKLLFIQFRSGPTYLYVDVSPSTYMNFCKATSKGKFFNEHISRKGLTTVLLDVKVD